MGKILFLDLDGTVRRTKSGNTFINDPYDQELIEGVEKAIAHYSDWTIIGVTNQGGVLAGFKSLTDCITEQKTTLSLVPQMTAIYFCTDDGSSFFRIYQNGVPETCDRVSDFGNFRKPCPGMVNFGITLHPNHEYLMVGDRPEDIACARNANIPFMWAQQWRVINDSVES